MSGGKRRDKGNEEGRGKERRKEEGMAPKAGCMGPQGVNPTLPCLHAIITSVKFTAD
jgi:hypothetical protein